MTGVGEMRSKIRTLADLECFKSSTTFQNISIFLSELNESVFGKTLTSVPLLMDELKITDLNAWNTINSVCTLLQTLKEIIQEFPPLRRDKNRFGDALFREWLKKAREFSHEFHSSQTAIIIHGNDQEKDAVIKESLEYLDNSFGSFERIDYGTGHELHFLAYLYTLKLCKASYSSIVLKVFQEYLLLMRELQMTYWLEPAGSHGVWGLDDYNFLPFLFGSAQMCNHSILKPKSIHNKDYVQEFSKDYFYFSCIEFINKAKSASLRWHSPLLDDISGVKTWSKVYSGLVKMYHAEVLGKLPIMQHFLFGSILTFEREAENEEEAAGEKCHSHHSHCSNSSVLLEGEMPSCCPRIPSKFSSIPFD